MSEYARLSCTDATRLIDTRKPTIVDIRDEASFSAGRIRGARHLDNTSMALFLDEADMDAPLIVCCYHGHMSQQAGAFLADRGFDEVYSLDGGFTQWAADYPDRCEPSAPTT